MGKWYQIISWQLELIIPISLALVTYNCNFQWCVPLCTWEREHKRNTTGCEEEMPPIHNHHLHQQFCLCPALLPLAQTLGWCPVWPHPTSRERLMPRCQGAPATFQLPCLLLRQQEPCPGPPERTTPAASPSPQEAAATSSTQAATNARVQEMEWPQISILKKKINKEMVKVWAINQKSFSYSLWQISHSSFARQTL